MNSLAWFDKDYQKRLKYHKKRMSPTHIVHMSDRVFHSISSPGNKFYSLLPALHLCLFLCIMLKVMSAVWSWSKSSVFWTLKTIFDYNLLYSFVCHSLHYQTNGACVISSYIGVYCVLRFLFYSNLFLMWKRATTGFVFCPEGNGNSDFLMPHRIVKITRKLHNRGQHVKLWPLLCNDVFCAELCVF